MTFLPTPDGLDRDGLAEAKGSYGCKGPPIFAQPLRWSIDTKCLSRPPLHVCGYTAYACGVFADTSTATDLSATLKPLMKAFVTNGH
jgi:hypothetical protein